MRDYLLSIGVGVGAGWRCGAAKMAPALSSTVASTSYNDYQFTGDAATGLSTLVYDVRVQSTWGDGHMETRIIPVTITVQNATVGLH